MKQNNKFLNFVINSPKNGDEDGIYIVKPKDNSYRAIWVVVCGIPLKLMSTSDGYTKEDVDKIYNEFKFHLNDSEVNFKGIETIIDNIIKNKVDKSELDDLYLGLIYQESVKTKDELKEKYPLAIKNWASLVENENIVYVYNGFDWAKTGITNIPSNTLKKGDVHIYNASSKGEEHSFKTAVISVPKEQRVYGAIIQYFDNFKQTKTFRHKAYNPQIDAVWENKSNWEEISNELLNISPVFLQTRGLPKISYKDKKIYYDTGRVYGSYSKTIPIEKGIIDFSDCVTNKVVLFLDTKDNTLKAKDLSVDIPTENNPIRGLFIIGYILLYDSNKTINFDCELVDEEKPKDKKTTIYNLELEKPIKGDYTLETAIKAVPENLRAKNFIITFFDKKLNQSVIYQYTSEYLPQFRWEYISSWTQVSDDANNPKMIRHGKLVYLNELPEVDWEKGTILFKSDSILISGNKLWYVEEKQINYKETNNARTVIYFDSDIEEFVCLGQNQMSSWKPSYIYIGYVGVVCKQPKRIYGILEHYITPEDETEKPIDPTPPQHNISNVRYSANVIPELIDFWSTDEVPSWSEDYKNSDYDKYSNRLKTAVNNFKDDFFEASLEVITKEGSELALPLYKVEIKRKEQYWIPPQKKILIVAGLHGSEYANPFTLCTFIEKMLDNNLTDKTLLAFRDNFHWIILPNSNPYGFSKRTRNNHRGVNLNRNFTVGWELQGTPDDFGPYGGTEPLSELETQAIDKVIKDNDDFFIGIDGHSFSGWEDYPFVQFWTSTVNSTMRESIANLAYKLTRESQRLPLFKENKQLIARIETHKFEDTGSGTLVPHLYVRSTNDAYCTLIELAMRVKLSSSLTGVKDIATMNLICLVNLLRTFIMNSLVRQEL